MFEIKNLSYSISGKTLFEDVSFSIYPQDKTGIAGPNGAGKTTLLKLVSGSLSCDRGVIHKDLDWDRDIFYLSQEDCCRREGIVASVLAREWYQAREELLSVQDRLAENPHVDSLLFAYQASLDEFEKKGGYQFEHTLEKRLNLLKLDHLTLETSLANLSGGEMIKLSLASILSNQFKLALLDEPESNLDIEARRWLKEFILERKEAFLIVSHDRDFLDSVTGKTLLVDSQAKSVISCGVGYSQAVIQVREEKENRRKRMEVQKKLIERLQSDIRLTREQALKTEKETTNDYIRARSKKVASKAKAREKRLNKILQTQKIEVHKESGNRDFEVQSARNRNSPVLILKNVDLGFHERLLVSGINLELNPGERVVITGANGSGKTALLKAILGNGKPLRGEILLNHYLSVGYLAQNRLESFLDKAVMDVYRDSSGINCGDREIRNQLNSLKIFLTDSRKKIQELSEGEKTRLEFALALLNEPDLLILDEPTNHLDISTIEKLEKGLNQYEGTLLVVTHDKRLISRIKPDWIWTIGNGVLEAKSFSFNEFQEGEALW